MPTVLRQSGFDVMIYANDHEPKHVHVFKGDEEIVINLFGLVVRESYMNGKNARRALRLVEQKMDFLLTEWDRIGPIP